MSSAVARPWLGLSILAVSVFGAIVTEVVPIGLVPTIVTSFDVDEAGAGLLVSLYAALVALTAVPLTRLTRHVPRKTLVLVTIAIFTLSNLLAATALSFAALVAARALGGIAHALFFAVVIGYAARLAPPGQTSRALALVTLGTSAGLIVGVPSGTVLAAIGGWRLPFVVLTVVTAASLAAAATFLPPVSHDANAGRSLVPGGVNMLLVAALAGAAFLGHYCLYAYVSPMLLAAGLSPAWLGVVLAALGLAALIMIRLVSPHLDARPLAWLAIVPATVMVLQVILGLAFPHLIAVVVLAIIWTASFGPVNSTFQGALVRIGRRGPEMSGAWINVACAIGIAGGTSLGGTFVTGAGGYPIAAFVGAAVLAFSVVVTLLARRRLAAAL